MRVATLSSVVAIGAGASHGIAVTTNGTVWAWGANGSGQVGDGTSRNRLKPVQISGPGFAWKVGTPTFSPGAGEYAQDLTVSISCSTPGATIHYTTDGTTPTRSSAISVGSLPIAESTILNAIAVKDGRADSNMASARFALRVSTPAFHPGSGTYSAAQTVSITTRAAGETIYYTTDGSTPTTGSTLYTRPLTIRQTTTVKAIGVRRGFTASAAGTATYTMRFEVWPRPRWTRAPARTSTR